jgi:hypothetical protein
MAQRSLKVYRVNKFDVRTDLKIKEGKLLYYEVTSLPNSKTRNYVAKVKTLREAREKAKKIASAPGYGSEIFRSTRPAMTPSTGSTGSRRSMPCSGSSGGTAEIGQVSTEDHKI